MKLKLSDLKVMPLMETLKRLDISDEEYFSKKYKDYISNSRLKYIDPKEGGKPNLYQCPPHITTQSLKVGSAVHECLLQPESFTLLPKMNRPSAKLGDVVEMVYNLEKDGMDRIEAIRKACTEVGYYVNQIDRKIPMIIEKGTPFWEALDTPRSRNTNKEAILLSDADHDTVCGCLESCYNNKDIMSKLHPTSTPDQPVESYNEIAFLIDFLVTYKGKPIAILKFKMKADNYTVDIDRKKVVLNDLKTTGKAARWFMNEEFGSLIHYHYYRQLALYLLVLEQYCLKKYGASKEAGWTYDANFLVVQTFPDYESKCYKLNSYWLKRGKSEAEYLLKMVAAYTYYGWDSEIEFE